MPTDPTHVRYVYKCRLCGENINPVNARVKWSKAADALGEYVLDPRPILLLPIILHNCAHGSIGIADLQGARAEKAG